MKSIALMILVLSLLLAGCSQTFYYPTEPSAVGRMTERIYGEYFSVASPYIPVSVHDFVFLIIRADGPEGEDLSYNPILVWASKNGQPQRATIGNREYTMVGSPSKNGRIYSQGLSPSVASLDDFSQVTVSFNKGDVHGVIDDWIISEYIEAVETQDIDRFIRPTAAAERAAELATYADSYYPRGSQIHRAICAGRAHIGMTERDVETILRRGPDRLLVDQYDGVEFRTWFVGNDMYIFTGNQLRSIHLQRGYRPASHSYFRRLLY